VNEINNILSDINHTTVTTEQVNKLNMSDISSIFTSSADTVFGAREQVRRKYNNNFSLVLTIALVKFISKFLSFTI
jgi:predicted transcriptional regulator with HTH domain